MGSSEQLACTNLIISCTDTVSPNSSTAWREPGVHQLLQPSSPLLGRQLVVTGPMADPLPEAGRRSGVPTMSAAATCGAANAARATAGTTSNVLKRIASPPS